MKPGEYKNMSVRTNLLISLRNLDELSKEIINEVDILDLKDPLNGSIGAWDLQDIKKVICKFKNKIQISATLGDIFINDTFLIKLKQFDKLNLDYIKGETLANKLYFSENFEDEGETLEFDDINTVITINKI